MTPRLTHCGVAATLVVAATGLVGCSSADPSAAAIVDGQVIRDADLWAVIDDLGKVPRSGDITVNDVLPALIMSRVVQEHASELKAPSVSADAARAQLQSAVPQGEPAPAWSQATIQAFQEVTALNAVLNGPTQPKAVELIQKAAVTVNPKYGEFDRQRLGQLTASTPDWMVPAPTPSAPAPAPPPGQPQPGGNPSTLPGGTASTRGSTASGTSAPGASAPGTSAGGTATPGSPSPTTSR